MSADDGRDPAMEHVRRGQRRSRRNSVPPISGQSGKTSADAVAVTCEPNSRSAKVEGRRERGEDREPLAGTAPADAGREAGTDRDVDQQPDQGHRAWPGAPSPTPRCCRGGPSRGRATPGTRRAATASERRPQDRRTVAVVAQGQDREPEDLEADDHRDVAMDPLDPCLGVVERREDLAVAERPVGAAEPGIGGAHDDPDRDQRERGQRGSPGQGAGSGSRGRHSIARRDGRSRPGHAHGMVERPALPFGHATSPTRSPPCWRSPWSSRPAAARRRPRPRRPERLRERRRACARARPR